MPTTDPLDRAVSEIREFSRFFTRTIGALDYSEQLDTPFTLGEARVLYELARRERTQPQLLREDLGLSAAYLSRMLGRFEDVILLIALALLVVWKPRENIDRLLSGAEPRVGSKGG